MTFQKNICVFYAIQHTNTYHINQVSVALKIFFVFDVLYFLSLEILHYSMNT